MPPQKAGEKVTVVEKRVRDQRVASRGLQVFLPPRLEAIRAEVTPGCLEEGEAPPLTLCTRYGKAPVTPYGTRSEDSPAPQIATGAAEGHLPGASTPQPVLQTL